MSTLTPPIPLEKVENKARVDYIQVKPLLDQTCRVQFASLEDPCPMYRYCIKGVSVMYETRALCTAIVNPIPPRKGAWSRSVERCI